MYYNSDTFADICRLIGEEGADAWVIYDFACGNPAFRNLFGEVFTTRKVFAVIAPARQSTLICHALDAPGIRHCPVAERFAFRTYTCWAEMEKAVRETLSGMKAILTEISENGLLPRASYTDYGTACFLASFGVRLLSSADLLQRMAATFDGDALAYHRKAARAIDDIKDRAFEKISRDVKDRGYADEYEVQSFIVNEFQKNGMVADSSPIVANGKNAASPHYEPTAAVHDRILPGDAVLIDLWAKYDAKDAVFADVTWMGYVGDRAPQELERRFDVIRTAIDMALEFLDRELPRRVVRGYEVDDVCRNHLTEAGYGQWFIHRTGHNMCPGDSDHGIGVNIDNYETHDTRSILDHLAFSLEPGIYMEDFGVREEINVYIDERKPLVFTPRQSKILLL